MAEIRINTTGGLKLYDADNSHYAQIVAGTITSNVDAITLGHNLATFNAAVTATGILKTDDTTEATSTTDGSLQTDGGLSVAKDAIIGDDLKLLSDSAVLSLGAGSDITFTHDGTTGLTIAATPISIDSTGELHLNSTTGDIKLQDGGTDQIAFDLDGTAGEVIMKPAVDSDDLVISQYDGTEVIRIEDNASLGLVGNKLSIANSSSDVVIKPLTDAKDIIFQQYDGTVVATVEDNATFNIPASKLAIGGTAVTATAAELNLLDGGTSVGSSITLADADGVVVNDGGTMKTIPASDFTTYIAGNLVQVKTATISGGNPAGVNLVSAFSTDYGVYVMTIRKMEATVDSASLSIRMRDANGARSGSTYKYSNRNWDDDGNEENVSANSADTKYQFTNDTDDSTDDGGYNAVWYIFDPADANTSTRIQAFGSYLNGDVSDIKSHIGAMHFTTAEAHNGIGFDITSGGYRDGAVITIYGVKGS